MIQIKNRKLKYRNTKTRRKAAFCGCGFLLHSKTYEKSMSITKKIIQQNEKNRMVFLRQIEKRGERND